MDIESSIVSDSVEVPLSNCTHPAPPNSRRFSLTHQISSLKRSFVQRRSSLPARLSEEVSSASPGDEEVFAASSTMQSRRPLRGSYTPRVGRLATHIGTRSAAATKSSKLSYDPRSWAATARVCFNLRQKGCFVLGPWLLLSLLSGLAVFVAKLLTHFEIMESAEEGLIPSQVPVALGSTMSLLLAFRLNIAYKRWWEARLLWGNLINGSRSLLTHRST